MKSKGLQPRLLYPARLSIKMEGQICELEDKVEKNTQLDQLHKNRFKNMKTAKGN